ncbi:MAG: SpoIVB peptidase [Lachnospiraceae bacterium]|nr:SpoIVB peptidase [Lachnospiraceae bacterium]MDD3615151.1 SpoIVB peptidase [Lachnospiraceae bacterium]
MKKRAQWFLWLFVVLLLLFICGFYYKNKKNQLPDRIYLTREDTFLDFSKYRDITCDTQIEVTHTGSYLVRCKLFGIVPLKDIRVEITEPETVMVSGMPIGIYMETKGVLVIDLGEIENVAGETVCPSQYVVKSGDYICGVNQTPVKTKKELIEQLNKCDGSPMTLDLLRGEEQIQVQVKPAVSEDGFKLGIWVRDDLQGIGTLTYVKEDGSFGALGHGINDVDTGELLYLDVGKLYKTTILSIAKGNDGTPGELSGMIYYANDQVLGEIKKNTGIGIFGSIPAAVSDELELKTCVVGFKQDITAGDAVIISSFTGEQQEYHIEIKEIDFQSKEANKSFLFQVTDPRLLELTGGIVQGMSGSPIIQNGKLIGAVTHVFVNDPAQGYGVFAETMLEGGG